MQKILQINSVFNSLRVDTISNFFNVANFNNEITVNDNLIQTNESQVHDLKGDLLLSNDNSQNYVTIRSNLNVNNNLTVSEDFEMGNQQSTQISKLYGNLEIGTIGKLTDFYGDVVFNGSVNLSGSLNIQDIEITDTLITTNSSANHILDGNFVISNGSGTVQLDGQTTIDNSLSVLDDQTFQQSVTINGQQNIQNSQITTLGITDGDINSSNSYLNGDLTVTQTLNLEKYPNLTGQYHTIQNVQQFGQTQDGITDDTSQIQDQIDFVDQKNGGIVYFPDTTEQYIISSQLKINNNIILVGDNRKGLLKSKIEPSNGQPRNTISQTYISNTEITNETPSGDIDSSNMTYTVQNTPIIQESVSVVVDGGTQITDTDNGDGTGSLSDGGSITYQTGVFILNQQPTTTVVQDYTYEQEIIDQVPTGTINSTNTTFTFTTTPIKQGSFTLNVDDRDQIPDDSSGYLSNDFGSIDYQTGELQLSGYSGNIIKNLDSQTLIENQGIIGITINGLGLTNTQIDVSLVDSIIENNTIINCTENGIKISGVGSLDSQKQIDIDIKNNYFKGFDSNKFLNGILLDQYTYNIIIENNYFESFTNQGIEIKSKNNRVESNFIYSSELYGIQLKNTSENLIFKNNFNLIGDYAIYIDSIHPLDTQFNSLINNNIFKNINTNDTQINSQVIYGIGQNLSILNITNNIVKRDSDSIPTIDYFFYSDESISDTEHFLGMNAYKSDLIGSLKNF